MKRFFTKSSTKVASLILASATFLSYFLGVLRDKSLAHTFGAGPLTDAYNASFLLPDFIFNLLIAGTFTGVLIPTIIEYKEKSETEAQELINTFLSVMGILIVLVSAGALLFTEQLMVFFVNKAEVSAQTWETSVNLTRIMLISPLLFGLSNSLGAILMAYHHFTSYALSPALYNVGILFGIWILAPWFGIYGVALGTILGIFFHLLIRFADLRTFHLRFYFAFHPFHKGFLNVIRKSIPRTISLLTVVLVLSLFSFVGSSLGEGSYSSSVYARNIQSFLINMFGVALATALLPRFSEAVVQRDHEGFGRLLGKGVMQLSYITLSSIPLFLFLSNSIIHILLGGGAFSEHAMQSTSVLLIIYALSIPFECLTHIYARAFYALQLVFLPTLSFLLFGGMAFWLLFALKESHGVQALALAWVIPSICQALFLILVFHITQQQRSFSLSFFSARMGKIIVIALCCALCTYFSTQLTSLLLGQLVIGLTFWIACISFLSYFLEVEEYLVIRDMFLKRFGKKQTE